MIEQKVVTVTDWCGGYFNFFETPSSIGSLSNYLAAGWVVKHIKDDPDRKVATVIFQRPITKKTQCIHEPIDLDMPLYIEKIRGTEYVAFDLFRKLYEKASSDNLCCKHCGVKIKAEKWVEA